MDNSKQKVPSSSSSLSSSSSIALELFGPKETPQSIAAASSSSIFGSVFGPSSMGLRGTGNPDQQESTRPWHYNSSIYYGGQDVYPTSLADIKPQTVDHYKKDGQDDHPDGNQDAASRGNWWQGSLYY